MDSTFSMSISSLMTLHEESWIDDDVVSGIMAIFEQEQDPAYIKRKGRPSKKRLTNAAEPPKGRNSDKCSKCGIRGHYKNTCGK